MSVYRVTDLIGTSTESWQDAASVAIKTASGSLRDLPSRRGGGPGHPPRGGRRDHLPNEASRLLQVRIWRVGALFASRYEP